MRRLLILSVLVLACVATQAIESIWVYGSQTSILFDPTVGPDGSAYYTTVENKIAAVSNKGVFRWQADLGALAMTPIALQGDMLFVGTSAQQIRAYSVAGNLIWKIPIAVNIKTTIAVSSDNTLYFATLNGHLYSVDGGSGQVNWHFYVDTEVGPPTIAHDGRVLVAGNSFMNAVDPKTGRVEWREDFFNFSNVPLAMDSYDNIVYIRRTIMDVYDYRGNFLWEAYDDTGQLILMLNVQPIIYGDILVAADSSGGDMYGFDSRTGTILWQWSKVNTDFETEITSSMAVDDRGVGYFCDGSGLTVWFDVVSGAVMGWMPSHGAGNNFSLISSGAGGYGVIRGGSGNKTLVGYKMSAGPGTPWSQYGGSAYHQARRDDPPFLTILSPTDGQQITRAFIASATASDDFNLDDLSLYLNGTLLAKSSGTGVSFYADSAMFQDGVYDVTAVARDSGGNASSQTVTVLFVNDPPVYPVSASSPVFSWMPNWVDNKYEVDISLSPAFSPILVSSATPEKNFVKGTTWQPSSKKWAKVTDAARASSGIQTVFYWRVVGKSGGLVTSRSFIIDKSL